MPANHTEIEKKLWASADELRATQNYHNEYIAYLYDKLVFVHFVLKVFVELATNFLSHGEYIE